MIYILTHHYMTIRDIDVTFENFPDYLRQEGWVWIDSVEVIETSTRTCVLKIQGDIPYRVLVILNELDIIPSTLSSLEKMPGMLIRFYKAGVPENSEDSE